MGPLRDIPVHTVLGAGDMVAIFAALAAMALMAIRRRPDLLGILLALMFGIVAGAVVRYVFRFNPADVGLGLAGTAIGVIAMLQLEVRRVFHASWARAALWSYSLSAPLIGVLLVLSSSVQAQLPAWASLPTVLALSWVIWAGLCTRAGAYEPST